MTLKPLKINEGQPREIPSAKVHQAVCKAVHDLGMQRGEFKGKPNLNHKIVIVWELAETLKLGDYAGKRFNVSKKLNYNLYKAVTGNNSALYDLLVSWRGRDFTKEEAECFDINKIIGANCMIQLLHEEYNGKKIASIKGVMPIYDGLMPLLAIEDQSGDVPKWIKELQDNQVKEDITMVDDVHAVIDSNYDTVVPF